MFQFLIGTLKTMLWLMPGIEIRRVSIPHRYAKNVDGKKYIEVVNLFQFLIGTLKTTATVCGGVPTFGFNSS